jgi:hypothetical protein
MDKNANPDPNQPSKVPVIDKIKQLETDLAILREGYSQCIADLEASNKRLVIHLGDDPIQLTGEVMGHRNVLDSIRSNPSVP